MAKKQHSVNATFVYSNVRSPSTFEETFELIRLTAFNILYRNGVSYNQWSTISDIKSSLKAAWDYALTEQETPYYFRRVWLDKAVALFGECIWCEVNNKIYRRWLSTNELPKTNLPKKLADSGEAVSAHIADSVEKIFLKTFH